MQTVIVRDCNNKDITEPWNDYHELLSSVLRWGLLEQCPAPFSMKLYDPVQNCTKVRTSMREIAHAIV
eukprot:3171270-Prorocentrum_lima.AAC.1